jgi:hypothetical protein
VGGAVRRRTAKLVERRLGQTPGPGNPQNLLLLLLLLGLAKLGGQEQPISKSATGSVRLFIVSVTGSRILAKERLLGLLTFLAFHMKISPRRDLEKVPGPVQR